MLLPLIVLSFQERRLVKSRVYYEKDWAVPFGTGFLAHLWHYMFCVTGMACSIGMAAWRTPTGEGCRMFWKATLVWT